MTADHSRSKEVITEKKSESNSNNTNNSSNKYANLMDVVFHSAWGSLQHKWSWSE